MPDREEAAVGDTPQVAAEEMARATQRLRENSWMIAGTTTPQVQRAAKARRRGKATEPDGAEPRKRGRR